MNHFQILNWSFNTLGIYPHLLVSLFVVELLKRKDGSGSDSSQQWSVQYLQMDDVLEHVCWLHVSCLQSQVLFLCYASHHAKSSTRQRSAWYGTFWTRLINAQSLLSPKRIESSWWLQFMWSQIELMWKSRLFKTMDIVLNGWERVIELQYIEVSL